MDLADQIDDYICSFEGIGDITMDSLAMFIFVWAVLALFLVWLCKFLYTKYVQKDKTTKSNSNSRQSSMAPNGVGAIGKTDKLRLSEPRDLLATKSDFKEMAAGKPLGGGVAGAAGAAGLGRGRTPSTSSGGGGGGVRRRMVRQSSTGPENRKRRFVPPPANVVGPEATSVTWTSQVFRWLYSDLVIVNELLINWVIALNDNLKKSEEQHGVTAEIVRVLPESPPPALSNIFCNSEEHNPADMVVSFDVDAMPVLQVKAFRQKSGKVDTSHYKATVSRFRGRMACAMNYNTLKGEMRPESYPDIRVNMAVVGAIKPMDPDEQQTQEIIADILTNTLRDTVYPVDFSVYATCPRADMVHMDLPQNMSSSPGQQQQMVSGRRLLVKIVKGQGLKDAKDPYVVVEMDEPAQKNQTGGRAGTDPYWDEHFLFELSPQSAEILFEVYDRPQNHAEQPKFLGLGLVGIDELAVGPASTQILTLQPRPYEAQSVSGAITVDFVFIEGAEVPVGPRPYKLKEALRISSPVINEHIKNGSDLADAAVRALQDGALQSNGQPSRSTLIIHSVQRANYNPNAYKVELNKDGKIEVTEDPSQDLNAAVERAFESSYQANDTAAVRDEAYKQQDTSVATDITASPTDSYPTALADGYLADESVAATSGNASSGILESSHTEFGQPNAASSPSNHNNYNNLHATNGNSAYNSSGYNSNSLTRNGGSNNNGLTSSTDAELEEQRGRSKKRNFFGTLKKRLSRSKTRAQSADRNNVHTTTSNTNATTPTGTLNGDSRSLSVDRGVLSKSNSLGHHSLSPAKLNHSRRSSISESSAISGFSSASTKTYVHEASTLVLETIENGIKRHFIVPLAIAQRPRWRRKGTKLHIYNDHTFVAKHLSGSGLQCAICMKSIPRRPGKQGYECRDCHLICHKQCHVRAPQACPNPTILSMELTKLNSIAADRSIRKV